MRERVVPNPASGLRAVVAPAALALVLLLLIPGVSGFASHTAPTPTGSYRPGPASHGTSPAGRPVPLPPASAVGAGPRVEGPISPLPSTVPRPTATLIDPLLGRSGEPAPMGVADFGVTGVGAGASGYAYTTPSFQASARVNSMSLTIGGTSSHLAAFELNAVVVFREGGVNYSYWIQNGLHLDGATDEYTIGGAYVWNFSSSGAHLTSSELKGDPSSALASDTYYFIPNCGVFAGQCSTLSLPATLTGRINVSFVGGYPAVSYAYDLGSGWVTYDTVQFLHLAGATVEGFLVDGYSPTPYAASLFYDAEWDWVGAGGGSSGRDTHSDIAMTLDFWNGHNYQAVPSAWNFGGDTGETSTNVTDVLRAVGPEGSPAAELTSGSGSLGVLYNTTGVGHIDVTLPPSVTSGVLRVNGVAVGFLGTEVNLTLGVGSYNLSLDGYSNASAEVELGPGGTAYLNLSGAGRTTFEEAGLPAGTVWSVRAGGQTAAGSTSSLALNLPNGTYPIGFPPIPGYYRPTGDPAVVVVPSNGPVAITWRAFTYIVPVTESGLPAGTGWWVNASDRLVRGSSTLIEVPAPNGSTPYVVGSLYEFLASPATGNLTVVGGAVGPVEVSFAYRPTFLAGTVSPVTATVTIDGTAQTLANGAFNDSVLPGNHTVVASAAGYVTGTFQVNATAGNVTSLAIALHPGSTTPSAPAASPPVPVWVYAGIVGVVAGGVGALLLLRRRRAGSP